jgi:hypothetical protein
MSNIITFRGYNLEYYPQPNNTYWGICRELGIRVREDTLELLEWEFNRKVESINYIVYLLWSCDQEDYYCTNSDQYGIEDLVEHLPELEERIKEIERRNTILNVEIKKL